MGLAVTRVMAALLLSIVCAAQALAQDDGWDKVVAAAKQEGKLTVYNSAQQASYYLAAVKSFEQKYGIKVETLDLRASEMTERIRTEQAAGRFLGDIEEHSTSTIERQSHEATNPVEPHGYIPNVKNLRPPFVATDLYVPAWVQAYGFIVNTGLVKPEEEPRNWPDLLDPKWKGKILSDDTRPVGGGATMFAVTTLKYGLDYQKQLATQQLVFSRDLRNDARRVARGEYPIYIPQMFAMASDLARLPVRTIVPTDGAPYVPINNAMLRNAPHPNAARLFMNHFLEMDVQVAYANGWMGPVVQGAVEAANAEAKPYAAAKLMGATPWDQQEAMIALAREVYK